MAGNPLNCQNTSAVQCCERAANGPSGKDSKDPTSPREEPEVVTHIRPALLCFAVASMGPSPGLCGAAAAALEGVCRRRLCASRGAASCFPPLSLLLGGMWDCRGAFRREGLQPLPYRLALSCPLLAPCVAAVGLSVTCCRCPQSSALLGKLALGRDRCRAADADRLNTELLGRKEAGSMSIFCNIFCASLLVALYPCVTTILQMPIFQTYNQDISVHSDQATHRRCSGVGAPKGGGQRVAEPWRLKV